jgi:glycerol-3-phosphate dehydrogenase
MTSSADAIVVGAGIQGAGIAQALAARGLKVLVVERAFQAASETSCKSSKLIHGGLRYLESGQWALVAECLRERDLLLQLAPQLVQAQAFYIPVYRQSSLSRFQLLLGLCAYRLLGGGPFRYHAAAKAQDLGINPDGLLGLFEYQDAQTDDAALTAAVLRSAVGLGCQVAWGFDIADISAQATGYRVQSTDGRQCEARLLINAAGPWINRVANRATPALPQTACELVQGTHLVLKTKAPAGCIYAQSPDDGRAVFLLPWKGQLMVGTTEVSRQDNPDANHVTEGEIDYLLRFANHILADAELTRDQIQTAFSGLRVLPAGDGAAHHKKRETAFLIAAAPERQYAAIYGGKLTAYRATAAKLVKQLSPWLPPCPPDAIPTSDLVLR